MKIRTSLVISFSVMAVLIGVAGFVSYSQVSRLQASVDRVQNVDTPAIIALGNIKSDFNEFHAAILAYNIHQSDVHLEWVTTTKDNLLNSYDEYRVIAGNGAGAQKLGDDINAIFVIGDRMVLDRLNEQGEVPDIERLHPQILEFDAQAAKVRADLDGEIAANYASLQTTELGVLADIEQGINITAVLTITAVAVVFATGGLAAYSISQRVTKLQTVANDIAGGNLDEEIRTTGSDEISALASSFEQMRGNLVSAQDELESQNVKLQELDKLKDEFIGIASHELRSPIHPILGYASMAKQGKIPMEIAIDVIHKQAEKLKQLANDILDVSRIESGSMSYNMQKVGIHEVLLSCLVASSSIVNSKEVSINAKIDEENEDVEIVADKDRLTQVFSNILNNAVKFTKKGSINVETRLDTGTDKLEISISDTGGGIPKEILPHLFGKFATQGTPESGHGTGLGLFISRAIVNAHGGEIIGYNNNIGGATFKIELPVGGKKR